MKAFIYAVILITAVHLAMLTPEEEFWFFLSKLSASCLLVLAWFLFRDKEEGHEET